MKPFQKVIKYGAIAFGLYLCFIIISAIVFIITTVSGIFLGANTLKQYQHDSKKVEISSFEEKYDDIQNLNIELDASELVVKTGEEFKIEVHNATNKFYSKLEGNTLKIRDNRSGIKLFNISEENVPEIILYIPQDCQFDNVKIEAGINETYIENINAKEIKIDTGVGKFTIDNIQSDYLNIDGGAGETIINNAKLNKIDLDIGVGKFVINIDDVENAKVEAGIGQLILNINQNKEDYKINAETGIGNLLIDGQNVKGDTSIGTGNKYIKVEAGVGEIQVNFLQNTL